nr:hypothetical protein [Tanacetum cinerariifolium]
MQLFSRMENVISLILFCLLLDLLDQPICGFRMVIIILTKMDYQSPIIQTIGKEKMGFTVLGLQEEAYMELQQMLKT